MKTCSSCKKRKPESEYQARMASKDHLTAACKECLRARDSVRYPKERKKRLSAMKVYAAGAGKEKCRKAKAAWIERNKEKRSAHVSVGNAIRDGRLTRRPCEVCGNVKSEGHHDDYSKPLQVRWLCDEHHKHHHNQKRERP